MTTGEPISRVKIAMEFSPEAILPIKDLKVSNEILGVIAGIFLLTSCVIYNTYIFWQVNMFRVVRQDLTLKFAFGQKLRVCLVQQSNI